MVKLLKQSSISLHFRKTQGVNGWTTGTTNEPGQWHFKQKYGRSLTERGQYLSETKDDRTYGEQVDDRLEAGYRGS